MTSNFFLFLPPYNGDIELNSMTLSWVGENNTELNVNQGLLADAVIAAKDCHVSVIIAGEDVLHLNADVPGKNSQRVLQAIPYVLEDDLIDDVEDLYFAIAESNKNSDKNNYNVVIINKHYFESIIKQLTSAGLQADAMYADYSLLGKNNTIFLTDKRVMFNSDVMKFSAPSNSSVIINDEVLTENKNITFIHCNNADVTNSDKINISESFVCENIECKIDPLVWLIKNRSKDNNINLLQGKHKKKRDWSQTSKKWLPIAVLFIVWISIQGGLFVAEYIDLSNKNKSLNTEITKIYKRTFPQSRRIIDAKAQMQQKLSSLKKRSGQSGRSFNDMLSSSAKVFSSINGLTIKSLKYYDGKINVEIKIKNLQALDKLKEKLIAEQGYQVEIQNASSGKESVTARLQILGAQS